MSEKYKPTEEQINAAKLGSNELFEYDVPGFLQPNNLRHSDNLSRFTGLLKGKYYENGVCRPRVSRSEFIDSEAPINIFSYEENRA